MAVKKQRVSGVTLIELMCVMAIIAILLALSLGPITKAYHYARKVLQQTGSK